MSINTEKFLTKGLQKGFGGGTEIDNAQRADFKLVSSHVENNSDVYHDEWFAGDISGGGQEIVKVGGEIMTRVYAGGTVSPEKLSELGITKGDVMGFLKKNIIENGEKIRLHSDFYPEEEEDWQYSYQVLEDDLEIRLTLGKEVIKFKGDIVFVHNFLISPVA